MNYISNLISNRIEYLKAFNKAAESNILTTEKSILMSMKSLFEQRQALEKLKDELEALINLNTEV